MNGKKRGQIEFVYVSNGKEKSDEELEKALKVKEKVIRMLIEFYLRDLNETG
ncbi:hypothetical protein [Laceyella tengchongensis]|jgi:hypothetical protein|uniref:hypothetical protein n=1 Tax=Laceyella tengchongensis TaxID=574699 RepID=UPI0012B7D533|nr:hypothetical protein [Laceyella tengchongensis]